jgi:hypothetical protein
VQETVNKKLYIDQSQSGKPVPTNSWWTDLVVSKYSGDLWADPFVLSNSSAGTQLRYPTTWNADGSAMVLDQGISVGGQVIPAADPSDVLLADFEDGALPDGWTSTGNAFSTLSTGTAAGQSPVAGFVGTGLVNSFSATSGDAATGSLTSPDFTIDKSNLALLVGGGNHPEGEEVRLIVDGKTAFNTTGNNSEELRWVTWDLTKLRGKTAHLEVIDSLTAGWAHILLDQVLQTDDVSNIDTRFNTQLNASSASALTWGDWNVSWRLAQTGGAQHVDVTAARGVPYTWFEFADVTPQLTLPNGATPKDAAGNPLTFPVTTDRFYIDLNGRSFGVHAPVGTTFTRHDRTIDASSGTTHLVVSAIPSTGLTLDDLHNYAFAVPRDTTMDYTYDSSAGKVHQTWGLATEVLEGTNLDTIQGWLPHVYRTAETNIDYTSATYEVPRGTMKTSIGHGGWTTTYDFEGLTPTAATPTQLGLPGDYSPDEMNKYLTDYAAKTTYGGDTYWGGKDVLQLAEYMMAARQLGDTVNEEKLTTTLRGALTDWYTYSAGEKDHFFARYPTWGALIGFGESYFSSQFTDNHFHYGYFVLASSMLAFVDPTWKDDYGQMATMVAKQYANWDRDSTEFPYLRTFDAFEGHSYAGGFSSPGGNNQESSSEAIQSWAGLFLLGTALGDTDMQATGAMGYVTERASVREYWLNASGNPKSQTFTEGGGSFPPAYAHTSTGILFDSGQGFATYFSGDPGWIYGIQWLPTGSWLNYLGWDPTFSRSLMQDMFDARPLSIGKEGVQRGNSDHIQNLTKSWYGIGTYGDIKITKDRVAAIDHLKGAIRDAEKNHPGYATAKTPANPLYDPSTDTLYVTTDDSGNVQFPDAYWTPETLPAALIPQEISGAEADKQPINWSAPSPLLPYLSTNYDADTATIQNLYRIDVENYVPGTDTKHAAMVFSGMGDALGNVILGFAAQYDPEFYADVHAELARMGDPVATGISMAGINYNTAMSNRALGHVDTTRHTSNPTSQVFYNPSTGVHSYVLFNPSSEQQRYDVYDGEAVIGSIAVPAGKQITSHLDAKLDTIVVDAPSSPTTVERGSTTDFSATGYDQYGATIEITDAVWDASAGGTVSSNGSFTATENADPVTISVASGPITGTYSLRVAPKPVLANVIVSPGFTRLVVGKTGQYTAEGRDQYGDPISLSADITWSFTGHGTITADGLLTTTAVGAGYVTAAAGPVEGSAVTAVIDEPQDQARGASAVSDSELGDNTADKAIDGDPTTRWESQHGTDNVDLTIDLGKKVDVSRVHITWENAAAASYELQTADAANGPWETIKTVQKTDAAQDDLAVAVSTQYLRVHGLHRLTAYGYSVYDLNVYGTPAATAIEATDLLVTPQSAAVLSGKSLTLNAYAFDEKGNGGPVTPAWTLTDEGTITEGGSYTAPDEAATATVIANLNDLEEDSTITTILQAGTQQPDTHASENIAVGKPVMTSSDEAGTFSGQWAVDDNPATRWSSEASDDQWISVDLGAVVPVDAIGLVWEDAFADAFILQARTADSADWETVGKETAGAGGVARYDTEGVNARFVRVLGTQRHTQYGYSLFELQVFSQEGTPTPNLALNRPATSSSNETTGFAAANAVDGNLDSRWASAATDDEWLEVDLGQARHLHTADLTWEAAYARGYKVLARSGTADEWIVIAEVTDGDGGKDTLPLAGTYRHIRIEGTDRATPFGYSLMELEIR